MTKRNGFHTAVRPPQARDQLGPHSHDAVEWDCRSPDGRTPDEPIVFQNWADARNRAASLLGVEPGHVECRRKQ